jgi:hypothetical protein
VQRALAPRRILFTPVFYFARDLLVPKSVELILARALRELTLFSNHDA